MDFAAAKKTETSQIPVIDITPLIERGEIDQVARAIFEAAMGTGFFYICGHGIDPHLIKQAQNVASDFFDQPEAIKASITVDQNQRGWMATGMAKLEGAKTHDLKEVFFWGTEIAQNDPDLGKPLIAANRWPEETWPRLRKELTPYYDAVCETGDKLLAALAHSLGQPTDFFKAKYEKPLARGQLVYYPVSTIGDESEQRFGVAPHTDFGMLTLLLQDDNGGLQVRDKSGEWIEAPPIPGTIVCNIGDLLQRWSNDRFVSTLHRVINRSGNKRYSIPVFYDPNTDAVVDPRDLGVSDIEAKYAPVKAGEHIAGRNRKNFSQYNEDEK